VWLAIIAGAPAAILLLNNAFQFENKSLWHFEKRRRLGALLRTSLAGGCDAKDFALQWNVIEEDMGQEVATFWGIPGDYDQAEPSGRVRNLSY
jgi:hypothetical protein